MMAYIAHLAVDRSLQTAERLRRLYNDSLAKLLDWHLKVLKLQRLTAAYDHVGRDL